MAKTVDVNLSREPGFGQCPRPGLGEVAAPELPTFDADEHETIQPGRRERVQVMSQLKAAPAAPLARRQRRPLALGRPRPSHAGPRGRSPLISQAHPATQPGSRCTVPSSRRSIVPLPATVSRSLPTVASQAIGFAEPRHGTRSPGFGACGKDGADRNGQAGGGHASLRAVCPLSCACLITDSDSWAWACPRPAMRAAGMS